MREPPKTGDQAGDEAARRAERLAQALRANLKRRKDQARSRDGMPSPSPEDRSATET
ncbi:hypothetical protein P7D22_03255 [Lichenihabitans sp. Uapishka_5]|uniref:hypothetical protein n=1 Tax=Lichenihabitans sp. Uapishka_5 TaxID=3037302 RepID=UPI0029E7E544|nr:hypothetical protein [Lichenihabitans sp. Uapishka_5]MDX7950195.1 hypothetical protein [Lichenihabitans sp. Uapishka_5]